MSVREPGGTPLGEKYGPFFFPPPRTANVGCRAAALCSCRAELTGTVIQPAFSRADCADPSDSTWAYQVYGRRLKRLWADQVLAGATGGLKPDLTLLFDLTPAVALARTGRGDRLEQESLGFFHRVRQGYLTLAQEEPERIRVIAADNKDIETIQALVRQEVRGLLFS